MTTLSFKDFAKGGAVSVVGNESNVQKKEAESGNSFMKGISRVADIYSKNVKEQFGAGLDRGAEALTVQPEAANNAIARGDKVAEGTAYVRGGLRLSGGVAQSLFSPITAAIQTGIQGYAELDQATGGRVAEQIKSVAQNNPEIVKGMSDFVAQNPEKVKDVEDLLNFLGAKAVTKSASMVEDGARATVNGVTDGVGAGASAIKDTAATVVGDTASKIMPTSEGIMQRVARIPKGEQVKFEKLTGKSVGQFLDETGNYGTPDKIVERLYADFTKSKQTADDALAQIQGNYKSEPVTTALKELDGKVERTSSPGAPDADFARVKELVAKEKAEGLTMTEINEVKRIYERRVRLDYLKGNVAEDVTRANNVDNALRTWQFAEAEKAGLTNLPEINKFTQANRQLMDALGKEISGSAGNNALGLTDAILLAGGSPESIASLVVKKTFSDPGFQSFAAKKLSKNKVKTSVPKANFKTSKPEQPQSLEKVPVSSTNSTTVPTKGKGIRGMVNIGELGKVFNRDAVGKFAVEDAIKNMKTVMKKPFTAEVNDTIIANSRILKDTKVSKTIKDSARKELADTLKEQGLFDYDGKLIAKDDEFLIKISNEAGAFSDTLELRAKAMAGDSATQDMMKERMGEYTKKKVVSEQTFAAGYHPSEQLSNFIGKGAKTFKASEGQVFPDKMIKNTIDVNIKFKPKFYVLNNPVDYFKKMDSIERMYAQKTGYRSEPSFDEIVKKGYKPALDLKKDMEMSSKIKGSVSLRDIVDYPAFFDAYPNAKNIKVVIKPNVGGNNLGAITVGEDGKIQMSLRAGNRKMEETIKHELQHYIQAKEGWHEGGSPDMTNPDLQQFILEIYRNNILKNNKNVSISDMKYLDDTIKKVRDGKALNGYEFEDFFGADGSDDLRKTASKAYRALYGEQEAFSNSLSELQNKSTIFKKHGVDYTSLQKDIKYPIEQEAKKSLTPSKVYHGTPNDFKGEPNFPLYLTSDKRYADIYQNPSASSLSSGKKATSPTTKEFTVNHNAKVLDSRTPEGKALLKEYWDNYSVSGMQVKTKSGLPDWTEGTNLEEFLAEKGYKYDAILLDEGGVPTNNGVKSRGVSFVALNKNAFKSK